MWCYRNRKNSMTAGSPKHTSAHKSGNLSQHTTFRQCDLTRVITKWLRSSKLSQASQLVSASPSLFWICLLLAFSLQFNSACLPSALNLLLLPLMWRGRVSLVSFMYFRTYFELFTFLFKELFCKMEHFYLERNSYKTMIE